MGDYTTGDRQTPVDVSGLTSGMRAVAAGDYHTCAVTTSGGVKCWGVNGSGQLGNGQLENGTTDHPTPVDVSGLTSDVRAIAAGDQHTCALTTSGGVKCWGANGFGQAGDGTTTARLTPLDVSGLTSGVQAIDAGGDHSCALTTSGGVKCWGGNGVGQLGDGTEINRLAPVDVSGLASGVQAIVAGGNHTCALTTSGGVKCWGIIWIRYLGNATTVTSLTPLDVSGLSGDVQAIAAGNYQTCALTTSGGVKCWGGNGVGQLGDGTTTHRVTPVDVSGLTGGVQGIAAGSEHTCALTMSGGVKCWGGNHSGELGDGTTVTRLTPVNVSGLTNGVRAIAVGDQHTCALTTSGGVKCWGSNGFGQLGDGTTTDSLTPVDVSGLTNDVQAIATGGGHTCALTTSGGVKCWGWNSNGQVGIYTGPIIVDVVTDSPAEPTVTEPVLFIPVISRSPDQEPKRAG